jgi:hypothetical protein
MVSNFSAYWCYNWKRTVKEQCPENREYVDNTIWTTLCSLMLATVYFAENVFALWYRAEDNLYLFLDYARDGVIKKEYLCFVKDLEWE